MGSSGEGEGGGGEGKAERCHVWKIFPPFFFNCHQREFSGVYMGLARAGRHLGDAFIIVFIIRAVLVEDSVIYFHRI